MKCSQVESDLTINIIYAVSNLLASLQNKYDFFPFHFSGEGRQVGGKLERRDYTNIHFFNLHMKLKSLFCPYPIMKLHVIYCWTDTSQDRNYL